MHLYNVPIIQQDLRHEETIIQAVNALDYLQNVIKDIFERFDARIEANTERLKNINSRIVKANNKVESLIGVNKAINIFSPGKYPSDKSFHNIKKTFYVNNDIKNQCDDNYHVTSSLDPTNHKNLQEKLQFYHVKRKNEKRKAMNAILSTPEGLGELPANIDSINALLLFNKNQNPYENYMNTNPLDGMSLQTEAAGSSREKMEAAPVSMTNRKIMGKKFVENLLYTPGMHEAPELDVPIDLPDLPGIADDITFNMNVADPGIAPSGLKSPIMIEIQTLPNLPEPEEIVSGSKEELPPSPPPPPIIEFEQKKHIPPPPPPPPVPIPPGINKKEEESSKSMATAPPVVSESARMNLMEAIRQAGGKSKLRAAQPQPTASDSIDSIKPVKPISKGGDLMADLHNKLSMRRKGISGAKGEGSVMDRVSAMIPPPPKATGNQSNTDPSDDDWE